MLIIREVGLAELRVVGWQNDVVRLVLFDLVAEVRDHLCVFRGVLRVFQPDVCEVPLHAHRRHRVTWVLWSFSLVVTYHKQQSTLG